MKPYGIISDTHNHSWSAFSTVLASGVNSRLQMILDETKRCAAEVRKAGGNRLLHAGDLFHVRGSIAPTVLNPTMDCYKDLIADGFEIVILAGNHDLEGKHAERVSSAITSLEGIGCKVVNTNNYTPYLDHVVMVPWHQSVADLKLAIEAVAEDDRKLTDLVIHAPIDDVIVGIPSHGLDAAYLGSLGFRRVFSGHYHNHKDFKNGVYSIGALAHHTWSDIGSKAGFLVVSDDEVKWFKSHAPEFVEISAETDPSEIELTVDGNFVRAKLNSTKSGDVEDTRNFLLGAGAAGVVVVAQKDAATAPREGATAIKAGATLQASVGDFIKLQGYANQERLAVLCDEILNEARGA